VSIFKNSSSKYGLSVQPVFYITQDVKSAHVLSRIKSYFGCGDITYTERDKCLTYRIRGVKPCLDTVIPHFQLYPLRSEKYQNYLIFRQIVIMLSEKRHSTLEGLVSIIHLAFCMNLSFSGSRRKTEKEELLKTCGFQYKLEMDKTKLTEHTDVFGKVMIETPSVEALDPSYLSGLVDGDGSFSVSFRKNRSIKPAFTLGLEGDNQQLLLQVQEYFTCGTIKPTFWRYQVSDLHSLQAKIIPHFKVYPLQSFKRNHFWLFARVCDLMSQGHHLNQEGFLRLIEIAYEMNEDGKRRKRGKMEYIRLILKENNELKV
jgi:LAGLIDADG endonuclease